MRKALTRQGWHGRPGLLLAADDERGQLDHGLGVGRGVPLGAVVGCYLPRAGLAPSYSMVYIVSFLLGLVAPLFLVITAGHAVVLAGLRVTATAQQVIRPPRGGVIRFADLPGQPGSDGVQAA